MKRVLHTHGIQRLYHFTSVDNLSLIPACGGLWSNEKLEEAGLFERVVKGGNELSLSLDKRHENWDKVHLYFCPNTPMAYRVQENPGDRNPQSAHICYLIVDPEVALWEGVCFTDTNATADGHQRGQGLAGLKLVDFQTMKAHLSGIMVPKQQWKTNVQAECLVPNVVPLSHIRGISFISDASLREGERLWGDANHPPFQVQARLFYSGFPMVRSFVLTSQEVTKENVSTREFEHEDAFTADEALTVTLLVNLHAITGTVARVTWRDYRNVIISEEEARFEKGDSYWHWPSLEINTSASDKYLVEYRLGETRWFTAQFRIRG